MPEQIIQRTREHVRDTLSDASGRLTRPEYMELLIAVRVDINEEMVRLIRGDK